MKIDSHACFFRVPSKAPFCFHYTYRLILGIWLNIEILIGYMYMY